MKQTTLTGEPQTTVVNCRKEGYDVYIGRGPGGRDFTETPIGERGWLGNPYPEEEFGREECIRRFREDFHERLEADEDFRQAVKDLKGQTLGCFCRPQACHGDVIVEYLDR